MFHALPAARTLLPVAIALAALALGGCQRDSRAMASGDPMRNSDLAQLTICKSTAQDVERVMGLPDERPADGSLVYRSTTVKHRGEREVVDTEVATFRFGQGVLTQICRNRS